MTYSTYLKYKIISTTAQMQEQPLFSCKEHSKTKLATTKQRNTTQIQSRSTNNPINYSDIVTAVFLLN